MEISPEASWGALRGSPAPRRFLPPEAGGTGFLQLLLSNQSGNCLPSGGSTASGLFWIVVPASSQTLPSVHGSSIMGREGRVPGPATRHSFLPGSWQLPLPQLLPCGRGPRGRSCCPLPRPPSTPQFGALPPGAGPSPEAGLGSHGGPVGQRSWGTEVAGPEPWGSGHEVSAERKEEGQLEGAGVWV